MRLSCCSDPALQSTLHLFERPLRPPCHSGRGATGSPDGERRVSGNSPRFFLVRDFAVFLIPGAALSKLELNRRISALGGAGMDRTANIGLWEGQVGI